MNLRRISSSILTRLLLLGLALILSGSIARYFLFSSFLREDLEKVVSAQQLALANYVARDIDYKIRERQTMLAHLAATLPQQILKRPDELRAWLSDRHSLQPLFSRGLFITDPAGIPVADYPRRPERAGLSYADRDYVKEALWGKPFIGRPAIGRVTKEAILPMAAPIIGANGSILGVLVGITELASPGFLDSLQQGQIGEAGGFLLVSPRDQLFVAASDPSMILKPTPPPGVNRLHDRAMEGFRGTGITVNAKGVENILGIASVPSTGWFVVARLPTSEAFATVARTQAFILKQTAMILVGFLVFAGTVLFFVFRPLFLAADHADKMSRGELPLEPLPVSRPDEIGYMTEAFNRLLAKLRKAQDELSQMAHHDALTGLPNRILLSDRLHQALARAGRNRSQIAVLFIDLDAFKAINDELGHNSGDTALIEASSRLTAALRESDTLARVGGDEFVILMTDLTADAELAAETVAKKCIEAMEAPVQLDRRQYRLGLSIGIAIGNGGSTADTLLSAADTAMYAAKQSGKGGYAWAQNPAPSTL